MTLPSAAIVNARHIVLVIAHGLRGGLPPLDDLPNLKSMRRLGAWIEACEAGNRSPLDTLLLDGDGGGLAGAARRGGRRFLQVLPWKAASWVAGGTRAPHYSLVDDRLDEGVDSWEDLMQASPRVVTDEGEAVVDDEFVAMLRDRVAARFPAASTMIQSGAEPLAAWMTWVSDAFLRCLWYASSRWPEGLVGVVCHPAPRLMARHDPDAGALAGLELVDDLLGRLLVLSDHRELAGSVVILCGDAGLGAGAAAPAGSSATPVLIAGAGVEGGRLPEPTGLADVGRWLRELAAHPAGPVEPSGGPAAAPHA